MHRAVLGLTFAVALGLLGCSSDDPTPTPSPVASTTASPSATAPPARTTTAMSTPAREPTPLPPASDAFTGTGALVTPRSLHTATLLEDGRVLVAGGNATYEGLLASAELYLPGSPSEAPPDDPQYPALFLGAFEPTGSLNEARQTHAATRLADGRVLVTGGVAEGGFTGALASAEIYDPATGTFELAGEMTVPRLAHESTLLPDGRVLIVGGVGDLAQNSAELFDPASGQFVSTGSMRRGTEFPSLVTLADGRVLALGLQPEIYDPASGEFTSVDAGLSADFDWPAVATALNDGRVLLTGDCCGADGRSALPTALVLSPIAGTVETLEAMDQARFAHQAVQLLDGRVLLTGGLEAADEGSPRLASAELFDPATATFTPVPPMTDVRQWHTMTRLLDGQVLVVGINGDPGVRSAELFVPQGLFAP